MELYYLTETLKCLPFEGGWADQPAEITSVLAIIKTEQTAWENEQLEKKQKYSN
ncbi:MAG: hypothetical protein IJL70_03230 [Treponema sp.]|nr:hypothetical protein [Treponema sp.]